MDSAKNLRDNKCAVIPGAVADVVWGKYWFAGSRGICLTSHTAHNLKSIFLMQITHLFSSRQKWSETSQASCLWLIRAGSLFLSLLSDLNKNLSAAPPHQISIKLDSDVYFYKAFVNARNIFLRRLMERGDAHCGHPPPSGTFLFMCFTPCFHCCRWRSE